MVTWVRLLLALYPRDFREGYGPEVLEAFREQWRSASPWRRPGVAVRTTVGLVVGAVAERRERRTREREADGMGAWTRELGMGARRLKRAPGFTLVAVGTVALSTGAFGAVFGVVDNVLLEEMPYPEARELHWVWRDYWGDFPRGWLSGLDIALLRDEEVFEGVAGIRSGRVNLATGEATGARDIRVLLGSPGWMELVGVPPALGPGFAPAQEDGEFGELLDEVVLTHDLWQSAFGADRGVLGRTVELDGDPFRVVGVMPPWYDLRQSSSLGSPTPAEAYLVHRVSLADQDVYSGSYAGLARVRAGTSPAALEGALARVAGEVDAHFQDRGLRLWTVGLKEDLVADFRRPLWAVLGAAAFLLLILGANLATLFLARSGEQVAGASLRAALGAGRRALLRTGVAEPLLVGGAGLALGALLAAWGTSLLAQAMGGTLPRTGEVAFDPRVLAGVAGAVALVGGLALLGPVARWVRVDPARGLGDGGRAGTSRGARRARAGLVVAQMGLALTLLMGAGLLLRSVQGLLAQDPGWEVGNALTFRVGIQGTAFPDGPSILQAQEDLQVALAALPGVRAVGYGNTLPLSQQTSQFSAGFPDFPAADPEDQGQLVDVFDVSAGYAEALGLRVLEGRAFRPGDGRPENPDVVLIDDVLASRFFPGGGAVGGRVAAAGDTFTIAGVVDQPRLYSVREDDRGQVYLPAPLRVRSDTWFVLSLEAGVDPLSLVPAVRRAVAERSPELAVSRVASAEELVQASLGAERLNLRLALVFALSALVLAGLGLYGVVAGTVLRRRREIGLRMALGADGGAVVRDVLATGGRLVAAGALVGVVLSWGVGRWMASLLFGVTPMDPLTLAGAAAILVGTAVAAGWLPARRAVRIPPSETLRAE